MIQLTESSAQFMAGARKDRRAVSALNLQPQLWSEPLIFLAKFWHAPPASIEIQTGLTVAFTLKEVLGSQMTVVFLPAAKRLAMPFAQQKYSIPAYPIVFHHPLSEDV